jgi:hypothetical protein
MEMKDFSSDAHVEEWMAENGGIEGLRRAIFRDTLAGQNLTLATAWLQLHEHKQTEAADDTARQLHEREVGAAEASARSAHESARWATFAAWMAAIAVAVSIIQMFNYH